MIERIHDSTSCSRGDAEELLFSPMQMPAANQRCNYMYSFYTMVSRIPDVQSADSGMARDLWHLFAPREACTGTSVPSDLKRLQSYEESH